VEKSELEATLAELRALYARAAAAREDEGTRTARELHDKLGQALTALTLDISWLREHVPHDGRVHLDEMAEVVKEALASTRRLVTDLRPPVLDELGLLPALGGIVDQWRGKSSAELHTRIGTRPMAFGRRTSIALYRVLDEALRNVTRHAAAKKATISFEHDGDTATLVIEDDGRGFDLVEARARGALGLATMRELTLALGGTFEVETKPGAGTRLVARVPVDEPV
jgi:signal transduction histidine kinase